MKIQEWHKIILVYKEQEQNIYKTYKLKKKIERLVKASQKSLFHLGIYVAKGNFYLKESYWGKKAS